MKLNNAFIMTLLGLISLITIAHTKDIDTATSIVILVTGYIAAEKGVTASSIWAASKDVNANTAQVIETLKDK